MLAQKLVVDYWHLVGHKSEVANDKDYFKLNLLDKEIVVVNDDGDIFAFDNICPHRGTRIFNQTLGNQAISCPYHGWTYRGGKLRIPKKEEFIDCGINNADINKLTIQYCGDFIFVGFKPKKTLNEQLGSLEPILEKISNDIITRLDFDYYNFECDWPIAIENALESDHITKVHKKTLNQLNPKSHDYLFYGYNSVWKALIQNAKINKGLQKIKHNFYINNPYQGYINFLVFPFTMLSSTYGYSYSLQNFLPSVSKNKTNFYSRLLNVKSNNNALVKHLMNSTIELNHKIFKEDAEICSLVSTNYWNVKPLKFAKDSDQRINKFRQCCSLILND